MLRIINNFNSLRITTEALSTNYNNLQIVRWRKPRSLPVAKSKLFRVPPRYPTPPDERIELLRLFNNYRTQIKTIRNYLTQKHSTQFMASLDPEQLRKEFEEDFKRCNEINDQWNAEQKILREKRVAEELEAEINFARQRIEEIKLKNQQEFEEREELVRKLKEESKTFIKVEDLDAAIENALVNPVDYNFAIDVNGNKIVGRETKPQSLAKNEDKISVKQ